MTKPIAEILDEMQARSDAATPGPWFKGSWSGQCHLPHKHGQGDCKYDFTKFDSNCVSSAVSENMEIIGEPLSPSTAAFIAAARSDVPKLVEALRMAIVGLDSAHLELDTEGLCHPDPDDKCDACTALRRIAAILSKP